MTEQDTAPGRLQPPDSTYDFLVFIGRFQPFHVGHRKVIEEALHRASHVVVLIGSAFAAPSHRNPFSFDARRRMIVDSFAPNLAERLIIRPLEDRLYNNTAWVEQVQETVDGVVERLHEFATSPRIGLIGVNKDNTSYYLKLFPQWGSVEVKAETLLGATELRDGLFSDSARDWLARAGALVPANVLAQLTAFCRMEAYDQICEEYRFIRGYRASW